MEGDRKTGGLSKVFSEEGVAILVTKNHQGSPLSILAVANSSSFLVLDSQ